jgi:hypothetical protein
MIVRRTEGYAYDAKLWDLCIVQGPFSVAPCQSLSLRFATFPSRYGALMHTTRPREIALSARLQATVALAWRATWVGWRRRWMCPRHGKRVTAAAAAAGSSLETTARRRAPRHGASDAHTKEHGSSTMNKQTTCLPPSVSPCQLIQSSVLERYWLRCFLTYSYPSK